MGKNTVWTGGIQITRLSLMQNWKEELTQLVVLSSALYEIDDTAASARPLETKWCKKEILGHLIDSAANNHQRIVRLLQERRLTFPGYEQDYWVSGQHYRNRSWRELIELWFAYNQHLAHVIGGIDSQSLSHVWESPDGPVTLEFLVKDYLRHLRHHLKQILEAEPHG